MPRRREVPKREVLPDPKYGSQDVAKFINVLMTRGKKSVAEQIMYRALEQIKAKAGKDALEVFNQAVNNVKPMVEVKSRRVGGANYQVPVEVRSVRRMALAMRWLRDAARSRGEKSMGARLAGELAIGRFVAMQGDDHLSQPVAAIDSLRGGAGSLHGGQQQPGQDGDDRDHHQQFDQRETASRRSLPHCIAPHRTDGDRCPSENACSMFRGRELPTAAL